MRESEFCTATAYYVDGLRAEADAQTNYAIANRCLGAGEAAGRCDGRAEALRNCVRGLTRLIEQIEEEG